jgi:hypothetical protein
MQFTQQFVTQHVSFWQHVMGNFLLPFFHPPSSHNSHVNNMSMHQHQHQRPLPPQAQRQQTAMATATQQWQQQQKQQQQQ